MSTTTLNNEWFSYDGPPLPERIPKENYVVAIPPQSFENSSSTLNYPIKGTDTITIGDQEKWALTKKVLTSVRVSSQEIINNAWKFAPNESSQLTGNPLEELRQAAADGMQTEFIEAIVNIDHWQYPLHIKEAIELALKMGCYGTATKLANDGVKLYPEDNQLQKLARVLAPPKVVKTGVPPNKGLGASMKWLKAYGDEYRGQWVVIDNGELLAHSSIRSELTEILENLSTRDGIVVTKVPSFDIQF